MTTLLPRLREEAAKHEAGSDLQKLLCWAELHIADQFDRICELEGEEERLTKECEQFRTAMNCFAEFFDEAGKYLRSSSHQFDPIDFAKDLAPWRNLLAANGLKADGTAPKPKRGKRHNAG